MCKDKRLSKIRVCKNFYYYLEFLLLFIFFNKYNCAKVSMIIRSPGSDISLFLLLRFIELLCRFIELLLRYIEIIIAIYRIIIAIYRHIIAFYRIIISIYRNN